ncbi:MAG: hypothetical protein KGQ60_11610 [Planctomycetes bacterium]|nr:hypothetical protein [Planctomycetota bacterium]
MRQFPRLTEGSTTPAVMSLRLNTAEASRVLVEWRPWNTIQAILKGNLTLQTKSLKHSESVGRQTVFWCRDWSGTQERQKTGWFSVQGKGNGEHFKPFRLVSMERDL